MLSRQVPILVGLHDLGRRLETIGKFDRIGPAASRTTCQLLIDQPKFAANIDERAAPIRKAVLFNDRNPCYCGSGGDAGAACVAGPDTSEVVGLLAPNHWPIAAGPWIATPDP